ncbi:MAG: ATP-binding protein, partial [Spirochaetaceae bacterium]|nr:ATP-binding protein [Spirochaetaceae bacterium]
AELLDLARECSDIVRAEGGRLRALIDRFRDLAPAALEARDLGGSVDLEALVGECAARARAAGAAVSIAAAEGAARSRGAGIRVLGDRALLEQAFWNLFANAIEAGGEKTSIDLRIEVEGDRALVTMTDSNKLADPSLVARLGHERITTKPTGTGLGLVFVGRILGAMGGTLELSATDRGGLGIIVRLPSERRPL